MIQLEHPDITRIMRDGPHDPPLPRCPVCGEETDTFYRDMDHDIVGCDNCIHSVDAWDYEND